MNNGRAYNCSPIPFYLNCIIVLPMSKIAVDIVLLPEEAMMDCAIAANARLASAKRDDAGLVKKSGDEIILNKKNCLPHISLAMGCINREDLDDIGEILLSLVKLTPKMLNVVGIQKTINSTGEIVSVIQIERSSRLQELHEKICDTVGRYLAFDVTEEMIAGGRAGPSTLEWIKSYPAKSSCSNFSPHITVGYGDLPDFPLLSDFAVSRLALCHLGNHCTCRYILWSAKI